MKASRFLWAALCAPALTAIVAIVGCGGDESKSKPGGGTGAVNKPTASDADSKPAPASGDKTAVEGKGTATLKGKIVYDGTPPERKEIAAIDQNQDKAVCHQGDTKDQLWIVGPDKGVANVVVWLRAPEGKFLSTPESLRKPKWKR